MNLPQWTRSIARNRGTLSLLVAGLMLAGAAIPLGTAGAPNPSGPLATPAAADGDATEIVMHNGIIYGSSARILEPAGGLRAFTAYDLTWTNETIAANGSTIGWQLVGPGGSALNPARDAYPDGANPGKWNVTFPQVTFHAAGNWTIRDGTGVGQGHFFVRPSELVVTAAPNPLTYTTGPVTYVITVSDAFGNRVSNARISGPFIPAGTTVNAQGQFTYFGTSPSIGAHTIRAWVEQDGQTTVPEHDGMTTLEVRAAQPAFRMTNVSGSILLPVTAPLFLDHVQDLGAVTARLTYDPAVVRVANVTNGNVPGGQLTWNAENGTLTMLVTTEARPGPLGSFVFANVTYETVGAAGSTSPLTLTAVEAVHSNGTAFVVQGASATFRAGLLGDVTGNGIVDTSDVLALNDFVVGKNVTIVIANADLNRDGRVTGVDALFLRQHVAGQRPVL